jgi:hypothetical protein
MMMGGSIGAILMMLVGFMLDWDHSLQIVIIAWAAFVLLACVVAVIGCFNTRFELLGSANQPMQPTPR